MRTAALVAALMSVLLSTLAIAQPEPAGEEDPLKERLGLRIGYAWTPNRLSDAFGGGLTLSLHFIQRIKNPLAVDVTVGAIYLGRTEKQIDLPDFSTRAFDEVSMRILTITAAPLVEFWTSDRTSFYVSAGGGLYSSSLLLDQAFYEYDLTNNYFGINGHAGVMRRIFTNWFLDLNLQIHKFWTSDGPTKVDWIYLFSDGDSDPLFWSITGGVALRLF